MESMLGCRVEGNWVMPITSSSLAARPSTGSSAVHPASNATRSRDSIVVSPVRPSGCDQTGAYIRSRQSECQPRTMNHDSLWASRPFVARTRPRSDRPVAGLRKRCSLTGRAFCITLRRRNPSATAVNGHRRVPDCLQGRSTMNQDTIKTESSLASQSTRRKFLKGAAATTAGASAVIAAPHVARAQNTVLKMQGSWGASDIFSDMARQYADRVGAMSGGSLTIDSLPAGAVVGAFQVQDACHDGVLDGAHTVTAYWYGKNKAASLFGTGPVFGANAAQVLAWIQFGGGRELYQELIQDILNLDLVGFFALPLQTLINEDGVNVYRTPVSIMEAQLESWDAVLENLMEDEYFAKVVESQKAWAERVAFYDMTNTADFKLAYEHYFPGKLSF